MYIFYSFDKNIIWVINLRLWHKYLIDFLPRAQLLGQIRELTAIVQDIKLKGKTNHILINKIMNYPLSHLYTYCKLIENEMKKRNYTLTEHTLKKWYELFDKTNKKIINIDKLFNTWHDDTYLKICYYNLLEKYLCGGISKEDFEKIKKYSKQKLYL